MLACATGNQGFGHLTGRLWGIRRVRTEKDKGERETSKRGALKGSTGTDHIENRAALSLMSMHGWTVETETSLQRGHSHGENRKALCGIRDMAQSLGCACVLTFFVIHKSCHPSFHSFSSCPDRLRQTAGYSRPPLQVNMVLTICLQRANVLFSH